MTLRHTFSHEISCGCVVIRDGPRYSCEEVLLVQPFELSAWGIPKGHIERGESCETCAIREVFEETGIEVELVISMKRHYVMETFHTRKVVFSFVARPKDENQTIKKDDENFDVRWWRTDELPRLHVYQKGIVNDAFECYDSDVATVPDELFEILNVIREAQPHNDDWHSIKNHILSMCPEAHKNFFTRIKLVDGVYKQKTNFFEDQLRELWKSWTGVLPQIPREMLWDIDNLKR